MWRIPFLIKISDSTSENIPWPSYLEQTFEVFSCWLERCKMGGLKSTDPRKRNQSLFINTFIKIWFPLTTNKILLLSLSSLTARSRVTFHIMEILTKGSCMHIHNLEILTGRGEPTNTNFPPKRPLKWRMYVLWISKQWAATDLLP